METALRKPEEASNGSLWAFLALTCLLSWPIWIASGVLPRAGAGAYDARWLVAQIGVFGPSVAALIVSGAARAELRRNNLRIFLVILAPLVVPGALVAASAPAAIAELPWAPSVATVVVGALVVLFFFPASRRLLTPGNGAPQERPSAGWILLSLTLLPGLFLIAWVLASSRAGEVRVSAVDGGLLATTGILVTVFFHNLLLGGSLGEEIGWRGFLLPRLLERMSPLSASLVLGVIWGVWHLPIDLYAGFAAEGAGAVVVRIIYLLPLSVLFTWCYLGSRGNLLVALLLHTSLNVMGDLGLSHFESAAAIFFVLMAIAAAIVSLRSPAFRGRGASGG